MLEYTPEVARKTENLQERVKDFIPPVEWPVVAPLIHCVADFVGDSLQLAIQAGKTDADIIVQAGVHFMAETSKLMSPDKTVLIPSLEAGCSLASSITGEDVRLIKQKYPGVPVVTYVNTSADVKAESDICCTSANAVNVVEAMGVDRVGGVVRGPRALYRRGNSQVSRKHTGPRGAGPSGVLPGCSCRSGLRRVHFIHDWVCEGKASSPRPDGHGMLDE